MFAVSLNVKFHMPGLNTALLSPSNENIRPYIYFVQPLVLHSKNIVFNEICVFKFQDCTVNDSCSAPTSDVRKAAILIMHMQWETTNYEGTFSGIIFIP